MIKNIQKVIYWHRLGVKVFDVSQMPPVLEKEVRNNDPQEISLSLKYLSGQKIALLLADSISYFYQKIIDPPLAVDDQFKINLLNLIKSDIPEDFTDFSWDYKIDDTSDSKQQVSIFAPTKEFQNLIKSIATNLDLKIEVIETESFAAARDPNPIIGITKKNDLGLKDHQSLNLSIFPNLKNTKSMLKFLLVIFGISIIALLFVLYKKRSSNIIIQVSPSSITPTIIPNESITPTSALTPQIKSWSDLKILVQNGTNKAGLAAKAATLFKTNGIDQVDTGNADSTGYTSSELIFKDVSIKDAYQDKFKEFLTIKDNNISIDNKITYDVIYITVSN